MQLWSWHFFHQVIRIVESHHGIPKTITSDTKWQMSRCRVSMVRWGSIAELARFRTLSPRGDMLNWSCWEWQCELPSHHGWFSVKVHSPRIFGTSKSSWKLETLNHSGSWEEKHLAPSTSRPVRHSYTPRNVDADFSAIPCAARTVSQLIATSKKDGPHEATWAVSQRWLSFVAVTRVIGTEQMITWPLYVSHETIQNSI